MRMVYFSFVMKRATIWFVLIPRLLYAQTANADDMAARPPALDLKDESVRHYERKSISYLRTRRLTEVPEDAYRVIVAGIRRAVELPRFDYNDVSHIENLSPEEAAQAVKQYLDEIKLARAREQAGYDLRFKDFVITGEDLRRIASSAYLYQPAIRTFSLERRRFVYWQNGVRYVNYVWEASFAVAVRFYAVDFSAGTVKEFATVRAIGSGRATEAGDSNSGRMGAVIEAVGVMEKVLSREVKDIDAFKLLTPIAAVRLNSVSFGLTRKEGLQLDQGFYVYEYLTSGRRERVGYVRVRDVGDGVKRLDSEAEVITARYGLTLDEGQLLQEYPQLGIRLHLEGGLQRHRLVAIPALGLRSSTNAGKAKLDLQYDIAERVQVPELFVTVGGYLATANFAEYGIEVGLDKRYYVRRLIFVPGVRLGWSKTVWSFEQDTKNLIDTNLTYTATSLGLTPRMGGEWFFTPDFSIGARFGYRLFTPQTVLDFDPGDGGESGSVDFGTLYGFSYEPSGLDVSAGINFIF